MNFGLWCNYFCVINFLMRTYSKTAHMQYKLKEIFEENLSRMEQDEAYKKEQHELAEADFL